MLLMWGRGNGPKTFAERISPAPAPLPFRREIPPGQLLMSWTKLPPRKPWTAAHHPTPIVGRQSERPALEQQQWISKPQPGSAAC